MQGILTEREQEIMNCLVDGWDEGERRMVGSYEEFFEVLDKLGLKKPEGLSAFIKAVDEDGIRDPKELAKFL